MHYLFGLVISMLVLEQTCSATFLPNLFKKAKKDKQPSLIPKRIPDTPNGYDFASWRDYSNQFALFLLGNSLHPPVAEFQALQRDLREVGERETGNWPVAELAHELEVFEKDLRVLRAMESWMFNVEPRIKPGLSGEDATRIVNESKALLADMNGPSRIHLAPRLVELKRRIQETTERLASEHKARGFDLTAAKDFLVAFHGWMRCTNGNKNDNVLSGHVVETSKAIQQHKHEITESIANELRKALDRNAPFDSTLCANHYVVLQNKINDIIRQHHINADFERARPFEEYKKVMDKQALNLASAP